MEQINGQVILLMAPSGSGKGRLVEALGDTAERLHFAKTYTTRNRRGGVSENPRYQFVTKESFEMSVANNEFVEWATFGGNLYGTPISEFITPLQSGRVVFKEMELQGIQQIQTIIPKENLTVIYIEAGGWDSLKKRIEARAAITSEELELRRLRYIEESKAKDIADVIISNRDGELKEAQATFVTLVQKILSEVPAQ